MSNPTDSDAPKPDEGSEAVVASAEETLDTTETTADETKEAMVNSAKDAPVETMADTSMAEQSDIGGAGPGTVGSSGRANAFAQLVRGWENYMRDPKRDPLQMFQNLQLCGPTSDGLARLTAGPSFAPEGQHPLAPPALRHTHSSPLQRSTIYDHNDEDDIPPPVPLDPFLRSTSTPSSFRQRSINSAFGTPDGSAFTLPSQRVSYAAVSDPGVRHSAFDPVKYYARALEDMERTSIEVTDTSPDTSAETETPKFGKRGVASRAARFLSDVRVLRRRRRARDGRENPAQPASVSTEGSKGEASSGENAPLDTSVTVVTEHEFTPADNSLLSRSSEVSAILKAATTDSDKAEGPYLPSAPESDREDEKDETRTLANYQQFDSDVDEDVSYEKIETSLQAESPGTVPSPSYQQIVDDRASTNSDLPISTSEAPRTKIRIQLPEIVKSARDSGVPENVAASPSPTLLARADSALTPNSTTDSVNASPVTTRSSNTGSTSGHTTQATSISSNSGQQSGLSTISETDREVMEANKEAKRRRSLQDLPSLRKHENDGTSVHSSSTNSNSTNLNGYVALDGSPAPLREGANVPADRFFTDSPPTSGSSLNQATAHTRSSSTRQSGSQESTTMTHTSSSGSSSEEPPTFVSYFDRQASPVLTSVREATEASSQRAEGADREEREGSPAEIVGYPKMIFEEAVAPREQQPMPLRPGKLSKSRRDKFSSRPPRSPVKGARLLTTPPPRGSVSPLYQQLSPPRNIVDHPDSNISRPYVMRTTAAGKQLVEADDAVIDANELDFAGSLSQVSGDGAGCGAQEVVTGASFAEDEPVAGLVHGPLLKRDHTYEESSIEILKTDSKDEVSNANLVTPEKEAGT